MPGKPVTDQQVTLHVTDRLQHSQRVAPARAGFSERTAGRIEADPRLPSQRKPTRGRAVPDPLAAVWEPVLLPILERDPAVQAVTLLRHLQLTHPEAFPGDRVRRTLERRVRDWRALHGPERDVIFRQTPEPGRMALSDFTDASALGVTIGGQPLERRLYHLVLAYSSWEHVAVVLGGESFTALAENLQNDLWMLGGVPHEHRTDSLSAAYRNLDAAAAEDVTKRYEAFSTHYGMLASRYNHGKAHENGSVEAHNNHLKVALDQVLILRGSRDFADHPDWRRFVDELVARRNRRREAALRIEMAALKPLPARRTTDFTEVVARVTKTGGFLVHQVFYSAPSQRIGQRLRVHVYDDRIEAVLGATQVVTYPRRRGREDGLRVHCVNDRSNLCWCSDGFEFTCWNGNIFRGAFMIDARDRQIIAWRAVVNAGISGSDIRDVMLEAVERRRFGAYRAPSVIEMLSDNGSPYIAKDTRIFARELGLTPCFTPVRSPQSNSISEAFVKR